MVSSMNLFSKLCYIILHIQHSLKNYQLLPVDRDFATDTQETYIFVNDVIMLIACRVVREADVLNLKVYELIGSENKVEFGDVLPEGILSQDRMARHVSSAEEVVASLCTSFLNLAVESEILHSAANVDRSEYHTLIPHPLSEESLRQIEQKFHNLQSTYDTFVLDTDTEILDPDLRVLRGHISIIFHLLETAIGFVHYYERHIKFSSLDSVVIKKPILNPEVLLEILIYYSVGYSSMYLEAACELCRNMLKKYSEPGEVTVAVPKYRGFHVRPSTLIAKIIRYYGSDVTMVLGDTEYNAGVPLELFRANEEINATKRRMLAVELAKAHSDVECNSVDDMYVAVRNIIYSLARRHKVVIYESPLPLDELTPKEGEGVMQFAMDEVARMLAMGKIDISSDIKITFKGDKRVLEDIRLLAENGYGEDAFGNNIPLPEKLKHLRL
jgi:hypothetical protein